MALPIPVSAPTTMEFISGASLIYTIISGLIGIILFLIWRAAIELKNDVKELFMIHRTCRDDMRKEFATIIDVNFLKEEMKEIKEDRKEKWKSYFAHRHSQSGRVEID